MGIVDKFKDVIGVERFDEGEEFDENYMDEPFEDTRRDKTRFTRAGRDNLVAINSSHSNMNVVVHEPESFDSTQKLVDSLKSKKPIIVNLENIEQDVAKKIFNFLSGATYALNGKVQKIANDIFIFAPDNVDISSEEKQKEATNEYINFDQDLWR